MQTAHSAAAAAAAAAVHSLSIGLRRFLLVDHLTLLVEGRIWRDGRKQGGLGLQHAILSSSFAVGGWRIGMAGAPAEHIKRQQLYRSVR
jgi:hypothetical protein